MFSAAIKSGATLAASKDPQFNYVTMLLHGDGTNGAQNNTFVDSSTNNFTITRNGNTTQGTFSPYGSNWSNYFSGSASRLEVVNSNSLMIAQGTAFTLESWVYINTNTATGNNYNTSMPFLCSAPSSSSVSNGRLYSFGTTTFGFWDKASSVWLTISYTAPTSQWFHFALVFTGTVFTLYVNGTSVGSVTDNSTYYSDSAYNFYIASYVGNGTAGTPPIDNMYISNFRYTKAQVYTSSFTPSTTPLTAIANTTVLTCQSNRFVDNSTNAYTVNPLGTTAPIVQRFSPFIPASAYSTSTIGGSGYFDGNGDNLTITANTIFRQDQGDWTFETWVYPTSFSNNGTIASMGSYISADNFVLYLKTNGGIGYEAGTGGWAASANYESGAGSVVLNTWNHIAYVRSSGSLYIYANGTRVLSQASATFGVGATNQLYISSYFGQATSNSIPQYLSSLRFVQGTALYTGSTYTVPTSPLTAVTNTSYLLNYTNAGVFDNAMMDDLETVGNAQVSTSVVKYGTGSISFDGTGDWLASPYVNGLNNLGGDFTIEFWIYFNSQGTITDLVGTANNQAYLGASKSGWIVGYRTATGVTFSYQNNSSWVFDTAFGTSISTTTWTHIAIVRSGSTIKCYKNGTASGTTISSSGTLVSNTYGVYVGSGAGNQTLQLNGYIDDLRITNGYARYTANFTPPTAAFPNN